MSDIAGVLALRRADRYGGNAEMLHYTVTGPGDSTGDEWLTSQLTIPDDILDAGIRSVVAHSVNPAATIHPWVPGEACSVALRHGPAPNFSFFMGAKEVQGWTDGGQVTDRHVWIAVFNSPQDIPYMHCTAADVVTITCPPSDDHATAPTGDWVFQMLLDVIRYTKN